MKHICSPCGKEFASEAEYMAHKCSKTGFTPADPKHLGPGFKAVSKSAIARGNARKKK